MALAVAAVLGAAASALLVGIASPIGWLDPRPGSVAMERKAQAQPAAPIGGATLIVVTFLALVPQWREGLEVSPELIAVAAAFLLGTADDLLGGGLSVPTKLVGQVLVALPLGWVGGPAAVAVAVIAMNTVNTFDNCDGAAAGFGVTALALPAPTAAGALLGFLPWNLRAASAGRPKAYLGDAGSHAIGMWIACTPSAWPALALPLLDLMRVVWLRWRAGQAPWIGDRRHLPQALERHGIGGWARTALLALCAAPASLAPHLSLADVPSEGIIAAGLGFTTVAFTVLCFVVRGDRPDAVTD